MMRKFLVVDEEVCASGGTVAGDGLYGRNSVPSPGSAWHTAGDQHKWRGGE